MISTWHNNAGFSLLEALVVSLLSSILIIGCVSFLHVQIKSGVYMHERVRVQQSLGSAFNRFQHSLERLRLPISDAKIEIEDQHLKIFYSAGEQTRNCLGTQVQAGSEVIDFYFRSDSVLSCRSFYVDLDGRPKHDVQPFLNFVHDFEVSVVSAGGSSCVDAVDIFLSVETQFFARHEAFYRVVYPVCDHKTVADAYTGGQMI